MNDDQQQQLAEQGWCVVSNVLTMNEIETAKNKFWEWLSLISPEIDRDWMRTWSDEDWPSDLRGIILSHGISQSDFVWYIRGNPKIKEVFAKIWNTQKLACSLDAVICWKPWWLFEHHEWKPITEGYHLDQNPFSKPGFQCVQGLVSLYDVTDEVGGLTVIPGTHNNEELQIRLANDFRYGSDWCKLDLDDPLVKHPGHLIKAKAGDLVLWDSRLIHAGKVGPGGDPDQSEPEIDLARLSVPICMMPREMIPREVQEQRWDAFEQQSTLTHWPTECVVTHEGHYPNIPICYLNKAQRKIL